MLPVHLLKRFMITYVLVVNPLYLLTWIVALLRARAGRHAEELQPRYQPRAEPCRPRQQDWKPETAMALEEDVRP